MRLHICCITYHHYKNLRWYRLWFGLKLMPLPKATQAGKCEACFLQAGVLVALWNTNSKHTLTSDFLSYHLQSKYFWHESDCRQTVSCSTHLLCYLQVLHSNVSKSFVGLGKEAVTACKADKLDCFIRLIRFTKILWYGGLMREGDSRTTKEECLASRLIVQCFIVHTSARFLEQCVAYDVAWTPQTFG